MKPGFDRTLFILAFDHRGSFQKAFFGVEGEPTADQATAIADAKKVIFQGFLRALDEGVGRMNGGILVDERFGADIAHTAKAQELTLAMPVERSGQDEFDFEFGDAFGDHIQAFDPTFSKVLVRFNPEADGAVNARQAERLRTLSEWLHARDRKFLFELLVPARPHQLEVVGGDPGRFDAEIRPDLMRVAIAELQESGVEPDVWKVEGVERREDCVAIANQCMAGGRDDVKCVVLGRGADDAAVNHWLRMGSGVPGYAGFAIGRSIWWNPLKAFVEGSSVRAEAAGRIAENYRRFIKVYEDGATVTM